MTERQYKMTYIPVAVLECQCGKPAEYITASQYVETYKQHYPSMADDWKLEDVDFYCEECGADRIAHWRADGTAEMIQFSGSLQ